MGIDEIIEKLKLEEKAALLQGWSTWTTRGVNRLAIPSMFLSDGPHGLRKQAEKGDHLGLGTSIKATCFPTAATMANSWDPELGELLGQALGEEAATSRVNVVLGPGLNCKRSPLCGRNFEYFSEDPYYDTAGIPVRYPFGYGRSYTRFTYRDLSVDKSAVSFTLKNAGDRDGSEVVQLYISAPGKQLFRPQKELKGFSKVFLKAGEEKRVRIDLDDKAFRYFNIKTNAWEQEAGEYMVSIAASAAEIKLQEKLILPGSNAPAPYGWLPDYEVADVGHITDREFREVLQRPIPNSSWGGLLTRNDAICQLYYAKSSAARLIYKILKRLKDNAEKRGKPDLNILFVYNMPFRAIARMTGGMVSDEMVEDILYMVNGHAIRGLGRLISDFFRNQSANKGFIKQLEELDDRKQ